MKLDYTIDSPEERLKLVNQILEETPNPSSQYLEILANYLIFCMEKQEKKEKVIITENRAVTIDKHETSYEGLVSQFENGEDGIYNLMGDNSKHTIFQPKKTITKKDLDEIPELRQIREAIEYWKERAKDAQGHDAYVIKQTIIEFSKLQYTVKDFIRQPVVLKNLTHSKRVSPLLDENIIVKDNKCIPSGVCLADPKVCSAILCNYEKLKIDSYGKFDSDTWYLMMDFDIIVDKALTPYPIYKEIVNCKVSGSTNQETQQIIQENFGIKYSSEYISSLWRNKIPSLIASTAEDDYLYWYFLNVEKGKYKKCSKCGKTKLAINKYFSKNQSSKDHWYSLCKECRNKKYKDKKA